MEPKILPDLSWAELWSAVLIRPNDATPRSYSTDLSALQRFAAALSGSLAVKLPEWWADALLSLSVCYHGLRPIPFFPSSSAAKLHRSHLAGFHFKINGKMMKLTADAPRHQPAPFAIELYDSENDTIQWQTQILPDFRPVSIGGRGFHYIEFYCCSRTMKIYIFGHGPTELYVSSVSLAGGQILRSFMLDNFEAISAG